MKQKIIQTKQDLSWHIVNSCLTELYNLGIAYNDKNFKKMLDKMQNYVDCKLALNSNGDILERYVIVLQKQDD